MELYTSYYSKVANMDTSDYVLIQVSVSKPKWFNKQVYECKALYPEWRIVDDFKNGRITEEEYLKQYNADKTPDLVREIRQWIIDILHKENKDKAILLCWEGKDKFCHRHRAGQLLTCECKEL